MEFILLKCIDYHKSDLRTPVLPSKNFPLVLKLLISKAYINNGSKRKKCDQSERDMDLCECAQEHMSLQESFGHSGALHRWKGMKVKTGDSAGGSGDFSPYKQSLT